MKKFIIIPFFLLCNTCFSQTFKHSIQADLLKSLLGLHKAGWEVFFKAKDTAKKHGNSFTTMLGIANTRVYRGWETSLEYRFYESSRLGKSWMQYGSLRMDFGNFTHKDINSVELRKNYFGISAGGGGRKYFFNKVFLDLYSGFAIFNNVPQLKNILYNSNKDEPFSNHLFAMEVRLCVGFVF